MPTLDLTDAAHKYQFRLLPGKQPRFFSRWAEMDRGYAVTATYDSGWTISTYPGTKSPTNDSANPNIHVWQGGTSPEFEDKDGLSSALTTAGYTVT